MDRQGFFYPLTVIGDATDDMLVVKEEQFGPMIPVLRYHDVGDAIRRANALEAGLGGSVWGNDVEECEEIASRLECGTAWVNQHGALHPLAPFGGIKGSGIGVEFNLDGLKEYTTKRQDVATPLRRLRKQRRCGEWRSAHAASVPRLSVVSA